MRLLVLGAPASSDVPSWKTRSAVAMTSRVLGGLSAVPGRVPRRCGDRTSAEDLRQLAGRDWDAVIDTSPSLPCTSQPPPAAVNHVGHYTYVSTISVYLDRQGRPITEESPVVDSPGRVGHRRGTDYREIKAGSERAVRRRCPAEPDRPARADHRAARGRGRLLVADENRAGRPGAGPAAGQ
jgi:hypothetical protein